MAYPAFLKEKTVTEYSIMDEIRRAIASGGNTTIRELVTAYFECVEDIKRLAENAGYEVEVEPVSDDFLDIFLTKPLGHVTT